ncbi:Gastrula zinc finger protein XlCGF57.1 [Nibea albiflora]|uniref:Gastrula zinc finger protein XlCGF57.1 n=1 Tax=Nibea albiflora TaxID=240163 RepID=A0ACB7F2W1_NIBAL|nr:Gastrula zinc finger protein XlCGF57.1 [Nibea albiflora]
MSSKFEDRCRQMEDHMYCAGEGRETLPPPRQTREEVRRGWSRQETKVNIGVAYPRWRQLMREKGFQSHAEVACFLLYSYESRQSAPALRRSDASPQTDSDFIAEVTEMINFEQSLDDECLLEDDVEENVFNDPLNSVLDLTYDGSPHCHQKDGAEDNDSSDDECHPSICIRCVSVFTLLVSSACLQCPHTFTFMLRLHRMGGALQQAPSIDRLPVIGIDETVHDQPAYEEPPDEPPPPSQDPALPGPQQVLSEENLIGAKASIVYEDCLRQLASFLVLPVEKCSGRVKTGEMCDCVSPFEINITYKGTAASVEWICPNGHSVWSWSSQPVMNFGMQAGDFLLSTNILLSGNNYAKVALLFNFMNMGMVSKNTFYSVQGSYCVDTIKEFWEERRTEAISRLRGKDVMVLADGRNDSPGHGAQYCSYITMENETKEVIHVATVEKRQTSWNSVVMEKEGFIESVDKLTSEIKLVEICTDAHDQIAALMNPGEGRYKALGIHHSLDVWHGAKSLAKKIAAPLWVGIIHHVCDMHTWTKGSCQHGHLEDTRGKLWIQKESRCHKALVEIVLDKCWLKDIDKYLRFSRSTADLETFQNHVLMYASKRYALTAPLYEARVLLAALDYNFHRNRPTVKTGGGRRIFRRLYKRNGRAYSMYSLKAEKTYGYISELQARIIKKRISGAGKTRKWNHLPDDKGLGLVPCMHTPATAELTQTRLRRDLVLTSDIQQVLVGEVVSPEQSPSLDREHSEALHIKEEPDELWTGQDGEQLNGLEKADGDGYPAAVAEKKKRQMSQPRAGSSAMQIQTESQQNSDQIGSEPAVNRDPDSHSQPNIDEDDETDVSDDWKNPYSGSETETDDSDDWVRTGSPESGVNAAEHEAAALSDAGCDTGTRTFSCFDCGDSFHGEESLQKHVMCHLEKKTPGSTEPNVDSQVRAHKGEKDIECHLCGKILRPGSLKKHMRVHTGEKPFSCKVCGRRFTEQGSVTNHMRLHTGEKPFSCDVCGKRFIQRTHVKSHMKVHSEDKPFKCDFCGKGFSLKKNLSSHLTVHTGAQPYGCDFCGKRFQKGQQLKRHIQVHIR